MKKSRFTDSQIMSILKQAEAGTPVAELCREHSMSNASFYKWRSRFGGILTIPLAYRDKIWLSICVMRV